MRFECFGLISWGERLYSRSLLKHLVGLAKLESKSAYVGRSVIIQAQKGQLSRRTADGITLVGLERQAIHSAAGTRGCSEASYRLGSRSHFDTIDHTSLVKLCASVGLRSTHAGADSVLVEGEHAELYETRRGGPATQKILQPPVLRFWRCLFSRFDLGGTSLSGAPECPSPRNDLTPTQRREPFAKA
jgi:hypothetical protein